LCVSSIGGHRTVLLQAPPLPIVAVADAIAGS
jgi:hypothetical protein